MRSSFLWRNRVLLISGSLLLFALHMLSSGVQPGARASRPALVLSQLMRPFQTFDSGLSSEANGFFHDYLELVGTRQENDQLKRQLAQLEGERARMTELENENRRLSDLLELREVLQTRAVAANIIGSDAIGVSHTLIISEGSRSGFRHDMAVVSNDGVVGKLIAVAPDVSRVLLIDDHNSALDAVDQRSRARGIVAGVIDDGLIMKYVDRSEDIKAGDSIVTSGMDGIFPRGLLIGQVTSVSQDGSSLFLNIAVQPAVDFRKLEQLLVLTEKPPELQVEASN